MMANPVNLDDVFMKGFPEKPFWRGEYRTEYSFIGYLTPDIKVGHITVAVLDSDARKDDFWFEKQGRVFIPRPLAFFLGTEPAFRGQGVAGRLLVLVNEKVKQRWQLPLFSGTSYCTNSCWEWKEKGYAERPAMRVWEKLEERGLAVRKPYQGNPRWVME